jgi:hypothetical protein
MSDGGPAFPSPTANPTQNGQLTVRDYFAGQVLAVCIEAGVDANVRGESPEACAQWAYEFADAMLKERAK